MPSLAVVVFILTLVFRRTPEFVENYYSQKLYPTLASFISFVSKWFPFSLDDLFYLFLILSGILILILLLTGKISFRKSGKIVLNMLAAVYVFFYFFWGFNYFRYDLNSRLGLNVQEADTTVFISVFYDLVEKTNNSYISFKHVDNMEMDRLIEKSYKNLASALQLEYPSGDRIPKNITLSDFFAKAGISGYYGPFFNTIHTNANILPIEYPFVLAHEKAHQFGITDESEANFYAWLVCSQSDSKYLQYSANLIIFKYFAYHGIQLDQLPKIISNLDENVRTDIRRIREHWKGLRIEKIEKVATKVNDAYLKTNNVERGIEDYTGVVKHVMDFSTDSLFQRRFSL